MKTAKDVKRIVIAGAGTMGSSMGETFAKYGYDVTLYDIFPSALEKAGNLIRLNQETEVAEHVVTPEESAALLRAFFQNLRAELRSRPKWRKPAGE